MNEVKWKKIIGMNLLIALMILSPFIPGPANKLVHVLSFTGQITAIFGLLLVPIGIAWTIFEFNKKKVKNESSVNHQLHYRVAIGVAISTACAFLIGAIVVPNPQPKMFLFFGFLIVITGTLVARYFSSKWQASEGPIYDQGASVILAGATLPCIAFICMFTLIFAFIEVGIIAGIFAALLISFGFYWAIKKIRNLKQDDRNFNQVPIYLFSLPLVAFLTHMFIRNEASEFSRNFAIKRSEALITSIENYKAKTGQYPASLKELDSLSQKKIQKPFVMGIDEFRYDNINNEYSVSFSQWPDLGLEEIVLYDKSDLKNNLTGEYAKYNYKFDLWRVKGAFASYDTRFANWKYYHLD